MYTLFVIVYATRPFLFSTQWWLCNGRRPHVFCYNIIINDYTVQMLSWCLNTGILWRTDGWVGGLGGGGRVGHDHRHINPFNAGTVFLRQNMTSVDVRIWRTKTTPTLKELLQNLMRLQDAPENVAAGGKCAAQVSLTAQGEHETFSQHRFNVGPPSATLIQHWSNIGSACFAEGPCHVTPVSILIMTVSVAIRDKMYALWIRVVYMAAE